MMTTNITTYTHQPLVMPRTFAPKSRSRLRKTILTTSAGITAYVNTYHSDHNANWAKRTFSSLVIVAVNPPITDGKDCSSAAI